MKFKNVMMLAISGCLAASFLYTAPALADDDLDSDEPLQFLADNNSQPEAPANMNSMGGDTNQTAHNNNNPALQMNPNNNGNAATNDAGGPDTATGDDDY